MRRDAVLLAEIVNAVERILNLTAAMSPTELEAVPDRRDSLLWNFTVLGEAVSQLSAGLKADHTAIPWTDASRIRNRTRRPAVIPGQHRDRVGFPCGGRRVGEERRSAPVALDRHAGAGNLALTDRVARHRVARYEG